MGNIIFPIQRDLSYLLSCMECSLFLKFKNLPKICLPVVGQFSSNLVVLFGGKCKG